MAGVPSNYVEFSVDIGGASGGLPSVTLSPDVVKDFSDSLANQLDALHVSIMENLNKHTLGVTSAWERPHGEASKTGRPHPVQADTPGFTVFSSDHSGNGALTPNEVARPAPRKDDTGSRSFLKSAFMTDHKEVVETLRKKKLQEVQKTTSPEGAQTAQSRAAARVQDFDEICRNGYATYMRRKDVSFAVPQSDWRMNAMTRHTFTTFIMEPIVCFVLVANTIVIGLSLDVEPDWRGWQLVDAVFLFLYIVEIGTKLYVLGAHDFVHGPTRWQNVFDVFITAVAVGGLILDLTDQRAVSRGIIIARLVKLLRMARIVRLFQVRLFKELTAMIEGLQSGARTLMWACILLLLAIYPISLILTNFLGKGEDTEGNPFIRDAFKSVPRSMLTVFRCVIGDCTYINGLPMVPDLVDRYGTLWIVAYVSVMMMVTFGLFNLIVAVFVDNALANAKNNEREAKLRKLKDKDVQKEKTSELLEILLEHVLDGAQDFSTADGGLDLDQMLQLTIDKDRFDLWLDDMRVRTILDFMDVPEEERLDVFDVLDADGNGTLQLDELINGVIKLRGATRRSDTIHVLLVLRSVQEEVHALTALLRLQSEQGGAHDPTIREQLMSV